MMEQEQQAPAAYYCSITHEVMRDPVMLVGSGHTYERASIEQWLRDHRTDPLTNKVLSSNDTMLVLNHGMRAAIEEWKRNNAKHAKLGRVVLAQASYQRE